MSEYEVNTEFHMTIPSMNGIEINDEEAREFLLWLSGKLESPPVVLAKVSANLANKLAVSMAVVLISMQSSNAELMNFVKACEMRLFRPERVVEMDEPELKTLYNMAREALSRNLEFSRKYIYQNKAAVAEASQESDLLKERVLALPREALEKILAMLEGGPLE